jgi:hypothetical protein
MLSLKHYQQIHFLILMSDEYYGASTVQNQMIHVDFFTNEDLKAMV